MGAWNHVRPRLRNVIQGMLPARNIALHYCGRAESASTAEGTHSQHEAEQAHILHDVVHGTFEKHPIYR
jgi:2-oxoglutarate dehydrogenase complex dehydrogenase (E1) component-like enzyme